MLEAPHRIAEQDLRITASIGIAIYPGDASDAERLLRNADFAMYQAKYTGRNNYQFFKPEMNANAIERQSVETDLRQAVARGEFEMNYQPKVNLETGAVVGVEALIRWNRPQYGVVLPARFIPIAEESGLILPIGRWALETACRQARAWRDLGLSPISVAINVSAVELRAKDFLGQRASDSRAVGTRALISGARADRDLHDAGLEIDRGDPPCPERPAE